MNILGGKLINPVSEPLPNSSILLHKYEIDDQFSNSQICELVNLIVASDNKFWGKLEKRCSYSSILYEVDRCVSYFQYNDKD